MSQTRNCYLNAHKHLALCARTVFATQRGAHDDRDPSRFGSVPLGSRPAASLGEQESPPPLGARCRADAPARNVGPGHRCVGARTDPGRSGSRGSERQTRRAVERTDSTWYPGRLAVRGRLSAGVDDYGGVRAPRSGSRPGPNHRGRGRCSADDAVPAIVGAVRRRRRDAPSNRHCRVHTGLAPVADAD